jgi:nitroreductase
VNLKELLEIRRSYRSLEKTEITEEIISDLASAAGLSPSCFNNQPWRFVFIHDEAKLGEFHAVLNKGNEWAKKASMIIAVFSKKELDCRVDERDYFLFDTGMGTAFLLLRAADIGLVAHPMAGYNEKLAKKILNIPEDMTLITIIAAGKKADYIDADLSDFQKKAEMERPTRHPFEKYAYYNEYSGSEE